MNDNMQYQPPKGGQTSDEKQVGMVLPLSGLLNAFAFRVGAVISIVLR